MSLHTRYFPTPFHAGPSAHSVPMCMRLISVLLTMYLRNAGASATTSGSGYCNASSRDQSRGVGLGETGCCVGACANARATAATPSVVVRNVRRSCRVIASLFAMCVFACCVSSSELHGLGFTKPRLHIWRLIHPRRLLPRSHQIPLACRCQDYDAHDHHEEKGERCVDAIVEDHPGRVRCGAVGQRVRVREKSQLGIG